MKKTLLLLSLAMMYIVSFSQCNYVIDMQDSWGDGWNGGSVTVSVNGAAVATWGLSSGFSGTDSLETLSGDVVEFSFTSGSYDSEITFQITDPSGAQIYNGGAPGAGTFLNHTSNSTCVPQTVNVTFQVDMGLVAAGTFTTPEVNGTWNNWCGNCNPMTDADGDGIWEATIQLLSGTYEYKYSADSWSIQEMNDPTAPCTNGNTIYTNRTLNVGSTDMTLSVVCWGSCDACVYPPQAPTGVTCTSGNPGFVFTDDLETTAGWTGVATSGNGTWRIDANGTGSSGTGPSAAYSGSNYFYFEASTGGSNTAVLVSPAVDISAGVGAAELTFWMHAYGSGINTLDVGVSTSATGPFTNLYTWSGQYQTDELDPWVQVGVDLTSYVGQTVYVAFTYTRGTAGISYQADLAIDYVQVASCLNCVAPSALMASNISTNSADVSWTPGGIETEWLMVVNGASSVVTSTTQALTGLMSNTQYDVQVAAICGSGDTSLIAGPVSFTTPCANAVAPYLEDFSAGALPVCFSQSATTGSGWVFSGTPAYDAVSNGRAAGTYAWIDFSGTDVGAVMEVIGVDVSALTTPELAFDYFSYDGTNGSTPANILYVEAHDGSSWVAIDSLQDNTVAGWNQLTYDLTGFDNAGVVTLRFRGESGGSSVDFYNDLLVDEIIVRETPSPLVGTWVLAQQAGALAVGPNQGDGSWWSNSAGDVTTRACLFDDSISFDANGNFTHYMDGSTWVEQWQSGSPEACGTPVAPHDGGSFTYTYTGNQLTVNGSGAHIGLPKVTNQGELSATNPPALPSSRTYEISFGANGEMIADINFGFGWWRYIYVPVGYSPPPPPPTYNVTLTVNTADITVGPNGMYAGGGFLGGADGLQMTDADGDGTWEAVTTIAAGSGPNYYAFFNSPTHGSDWGTKEDLNGQSCGDAANYNDRVLPTITSDTTVQHCFGSCETDGTCGAVGGCYYVIDMQDSYGDGWNGGSVTVSVNGAAVATWGLSSGSSGTDSLETLNGDVVEFSFTSGSWDSEITFQITDPSGAQIYNGGAPGAGTFLNHTSNSTCVPQTVNVTFQVDMGLVAAGTFTTPEVNGTWNNWCGNCDPMTDADGDGIWEATIQLLSGTYEYKYSADSWSIQEMNDPTAPCTNGNTIYTNRTLSVGTADITIPIVCWGSCDPCVYPPQAPTGVTCTSGNPGFVFTDDLETTAGWTGVATSGNGTWRLNNNTTTSTATGPSAAYSGSNYFYFEASTGGADTAVLVSPAVDLSAGIDGAELTFWMHAYGSGINTLDVGVSTSATGPFTNLYTWSGQYQAVETDPWYQVGVDLTSYLGQTVYIAFTYTRGPAGISYQADLAIDYVQVAGCGFTSSSPLVGTWKLAQQAGALAVGPNQGDGSWWSNSAGDVTTRACLFDDSISFDVNGNFTHYMDGSTWVEQWQSGSPEACGTPVAPHDGGSFTYTYTGNQLTVIGSGAHIGLPKVTNQGELNAGATLPSSRTYDISFGANGEMIADINFGVGWWRYIYVPTTACGLAIAPYSENFDAGFSPCWTQETADDFDWTVDAGGTPSGGTGPSDDITGGGNYMYTEASVPRAAGDSAILISQDIYIASLTNPELKFYSHMYGTAIGTLRVDMYDGTNYTTVFSKSGDQGEQWIEESVLLSTTAPIVHFKIVAVLSTNSGGQTWPGDIAIDNFEVGEATVNDLAIIDASVPSDCEFDTTQYVSITVVNKGLVTENTFDASYSLNGAASVTETNSIPMNPGDTLVFPFFTGVDMTFDGIYSFDFSLTSAADEDLSNNNLTASGENFFTPAVPVVIGDTICNGDTAHVMAMSADGPITWYDAMTGGNVVGSGDNLHIAPTATTSYYAEAKAASGFSDDFESYNVGDFIAQSDTVNWATWPGGTLGGLYDAPVSNAQAASGSNSLHLDNAASNVPDPVFPFGGQTWTSGAFEFSTNIYVETTAYFNLQGSATFGTVWAMEMTFTGAGGLTDPFTFDLGGGAITGSYPGTGTWFNVTLKCADLTTGTWELFIDGVSKGTATLPNATAVGGCNLYAAAGNNYYIDDISWSAVPADACTGARTEAVVTVGNASAGTDVITACDSYTWIDGITYTSSNDSATYTLQTINGCDSVVTLDLTINYSTAGTDVITACDSYTWIDGITYTSSNNTATYTYQDTGSFNPGITFDIVSPSSLSGSIFGFTSTNDVAGWGSPDLNLPINSINAQLMMVEDGTPGTNPQGNPISQEGCSPLINDLTGKIAVIWRNTCQFGQKILNAQNAGAIGAIIVNREPGLVNMAPGDSGAVCTIPAIFIEYSAGLQIVNQMQNGPVQAFIGTSVNGNSVSCDSTVTLDLTINYSTTGTDVITACDSYTWIDGITYTSSNDSATYTLQTINGCDSVVTLDLTINYSTAGTDVITACDSYTWIDGITYTSSNDSATYTLQTIDGCDSVVTLDLTINYSTAGTDVITACDSYTWIDGITYTSSNDSATYTLQTIDGCDSVVTLDLAINYSTAGTDVITACDSYTWIDGITYTSSNDSATYTLQTIDGCDSVVTLDLVVNYSSSSYDTITACYDYIWNGNTYTSSGDYVDTLQTTNGCDSIANLNLTLVDLIVEIDTAQLSLVAKIISGMGPFNYVWSTGDTTSTITPSANGQYWLVVADVNGCISDTVFYDVTFLSNVGIVNNGHPMIVNVYPNPTFGTLTIDLAKQESEVQITLYDMYGKLVYLNKYQDSRLIEFSFDAPPGIYYLDIKSGEKSSRHKIIMQ